MKTIELDPITKEVISMPWQSCPLGANNPMACMFCPYGHMTECHHPLSCEEAECSHYQAELEYDESGEY